MSKITTRSAFFYGTTVTQFNRSIDFDEGAGEIQATLDIGDYSYTEYIQAIALAMTLAGGQPYVATPDRATGKWTISAASNFSLLVSTGSRVATSVWGMAGFTGSDKTGANSYLSQESAGSIYETQHPVDNYLAPDENIHKEQATLNQTASGVTQIISFDDSSRIRMNIRLITNNLNLKNTPFYSNASGIQDAKDFMTYLLTKSRVEFMPDTDTKTTFHTCLLESTKQDRSGLIFEFENMSPDILQTGLLTFRKVGN